MSWSSRHPAPPPPPRSTFSKLFPLLLTLFLLALAGFVAYHLYLSFLTIREAAHNKLESKNVTFTKQGIRVGVKPINNESYVDQTQSFLVKAWNLSTWPAYRSRFWNQGAQEGGNGNGGNGNGSGGSGNGVQVHAEKEKGVLRKPYPGSAQ